MEKFRLNKYIAKCGICSRRKAAELVKDGLIKVNGQVEINPAIEVTDEDVIEYNKKVLKREVKLIYLLLNKPKNVLTTMDDEHERKTVWDMVREKVDERIFPVGRLDMMTTGLLLLTNDGDLTQKLSHPKFETKKIYEVTIDRDISDEDFQKIKDGVELEDGVAKVDKISILENDKTLFGIEIHSGKNRIIRRIFEHLEYSIIRLDRVYYAGLTKKDLPRGWSRFLGQQEIVMLKHFKPN